MPKNVQQFLIYLVLVVSSAYAMSIDTTLIANGSAGPYSLGPYFLDTATLTVELEDSVRSAHSVRINEGTGLIFSEPIDSGVPIRVRYEVDFYGLRRRYWLFSPSYLDTNDTAGVTSPVGAARYGNDPTERPVTLSGYKSIGISLGSQGRMNLEQALEVSVFGKIAPQTELSANISDQGTSLEGVTREIGELDMVYVSLVNPRYDVTVGDQYQVWPEGGLLEGSKKVKGISANYKGRHLSAGGFGAITGGKYAIQTIYGQFGFQGPYYLIGNGEADYINPIGGTVRVRVQGKELEEGEDKDYVVDYDLASITFTPRFPIRDEHIIRVDYEYKVFDYQRTSAGAVLRGASRDSVVTASGVVWVETDNKEHPIDLPVHIDSARGPLRSAGDDLPLVPNGRKVHPNDVDEKSALMPLYRIEYRGDTLVYVHEPHPRPTHDLYNVWFRAVGSGEGRYYRDSSYTNDGRRVYVYHYDTTGRGDYSARSPVPAPERIVVSETRLDAAPSDWLELSGDLAVHDHDRNLFSDLDDEDNTGLVSRSRMRLGRKSEDLRSFWLEGHHTFISPRFGREVVSVYDRRMQWDREYDTAEGKRLNLWDATVGLTAWPGIGNTLKYGQYVRDDTIATQRWSNKTFIRPQGPFSFEYQGDLFLHEDGPVERTRRRNRVRLGLKHGQFTWTIPLDEEWESNDTSFVGRGSAGGGIECFFEPLSLEESVYYSRRFKDERGIFGSILGAGSVPHDTSSLFLWTQRFSHSLLDAWTLSSTSTYQRRTVERDSLPNLTLASLLITATNEVSSIRTGFATRQHLSMNTERASSFVFVTDYAGGPGLGDYSIDSITNVPYYDPGGDYYAYEKEIYDTTGKRTRKALVEWDWSFAPPAGLIPGILGDVDWRGLLSLEEHVVSDGNEAVRNWLPGYVILNGSEKDDSLVTFADISYRQEMDWCPDSLLGLHTGVYFMPSLQKARGQLETRREWGAHIDWSANQWRFELQSKLVRLNQKGLIPTYSDTFSIVDRHVTLTERLELGPRWSLFCRETIGKSRRWGDIDSANGSYYILQPGVTFHPPGKGIAELSYSFANVDIGGPLDYRMALGREGGVSHLIEAYANINVGEHFSLGGTYRAEWVRPFDDKVFRDGIHMFSMEVKAHL
ncbi:MAG: hypothetical protein GF344_08810 [Chitinivibrionales bacterium]|nr:hypothetical protein [Chitinivibrionales bacterium]MBD3356959.1 hypothetical protein [Chitinivibrionales bacterium]